jgi:hypothetical protein
VSDHLLPVTRQWRVGDGNDFAARTERPNTLHLIMLDTPNIDFRVALPRDI